MLELTPALNLVLALIILILIGGVFVVFELKSLRLQIRERAYKLYFETTRKADLLPRAINRLRVHAPNFDFGPLIGLRRDSLSKTVFSPEKKALEDALWTLFQEINLQSRTWPGVKNDHLLSALETDLKAADERVEAMKISYNKMVARNNKLAGNLLLKPAAMIAGSRVLSLW